MSKPPLDYRHADDSDGANPGVRWQTVVSCSLLGIGLLCGIGALVWTQHHRELFSAAISLGVAGVIIYFPYVRT